MNVSAVNASNSHAAELAAAGNSGALSHMPKAQQVKAVAGQFEAIIIRQLLQDSVSKIMGGEKGGPTGNVYGFMLTDLLSSKLAEGNGLGLGQMLEHQLSPRPARLSDDAVETKGNP